MARICDMKDCNEEIADWMQYCSKHYAQVEQQKKESAIEQPEAQQPVQQQVVEQPKPIEQQGQQQSYSQENKQVSPEPKPIPIPKVIDIVDDKPVTDEKQMLPLEKLQGKDRLIVKQVAMKCAVEFLQQTPVEYNDYPEMVGQLRRLVVDMYRIIVEKNEQ